MVIANPIYDVVFKRLMEDKRIARFFIETLLEEPVEEVWLKPQELTRADDENRLTLFRLDFIATIKTAAGEHKSVLIEIQKAKNVVDLMRFRNYLGEQYKKEEVVATEDGNETAPLPIVTIYLLGFTLPGIETPAVKVAREYIDLMTHLAIPRKTDFIEKLTHDCFVVQLPRIKGRLQTKIGELLNVFEQKYFIDGKGAIKEYKYNIPNDDIRRIVEKLNFEGTDPNRKKEILAEQEYWRTFYAAAGDDYWKVVAKYEAADRAREEERKAKEEAERAREDAERAKEEAERIKGEALLAMELMKKEIEEIKEMLLKKT